MSKQIYINGKERNYEKFLNFYYRIKQEKGYNSYVFEIDCNKFRINLNFDFYIIFRVFYT